MIKETMKNWQWKNDNEKGPRRQMCHRGPNQKEAATYSPALHCSTIGAGGLNFSVRNGKRWDPTAITTWMSSDQLGLGVQLYWLFLETISCTVLCNLLSVSRPYGWLIATSKNRVSTKSFNWNYELLSLWLYVFRVCHASCFQAGKQSNTH